MTIVKTILVLYLVLRLTRELRLYFPLDAILLLQKRTCKHKELSLNFRGVYPVQPGTSREIKGQKEGGISFSDFDFDLTRRDLVLKTFRNKFSYLNHLKINSRYKFSYW